MTIKLQDAELKVMDVIWRCGKVSAKDISMVLTERYGWKKNTTYTLIKRCIDKGAIERIEPNFICRALIPREEVQKAERIYTLLRPKGWKQIFRLYSFYHLEIENFDIIIHRLF